MSKPDTIDAYLAPLPPVQRAALEQLRQRINDRLPGNVEGISYGMPVHKLGGKAIAGYGAFKAHLSYFPHSSLTLPQVEPVLMSLGFRASKGGFQFRPGDTIPDDLLDRLITLRLAETGLA